MELKFWMELLLIVLFALEESTRSLFESVDRMDLLLNALNRHCNIAFLKPCPLHIKRNLIHHGYTTKKLLSLYWEATNAPTFSQYENIMQEMRTAGNGKGEKMAQ